MKRENIISALRTCAASESAPDCRECPYYDHSPACINKLMKDAADALEKLLGEGRRMAEYDEARRGHAARTAE